MSAKGSYRADPPPVIFFGCLSGSGHFFAYPPKWGRAPWHPNEQGVGLPEAWGHVDGKLAPQGDTRQSVARLHHLDGWSAVGMHDYTEDSRGGCNANFLVHQPDLTMAEVLAIAAEYFPAIVKRLGEITDADAPTPTKWTIVSVAELAQLREASR